MGGASAGSACCCSSQDEQGSLLAPFGPPDARGSDSALSSDYSPDACVTSFKTPDGGSTRANFKTKSGGFGLKNFCPINDGKIEDFYSTGSELLGEGGFGSVRRGTNNHTGMKFAIKSIQKDGLLSDDETALEKLTEEIEIMRLLDHPNIIRFQESFEEFNQIHLVLECCEGGDLLQSLQADRSFTETSASQCIRQMLLALNYLHHNHIMHRDIKPENWLLAAKGGISGAKLKLIDFGFAKRFRPGVKLHTQCGTPYYISPETLEGEYDERADLWSVGVITYLIISGKLPFIGRTATAVLGKVVSGTIKITGNSWDNVSEDAKVFVKACLQRDLSSRPSAQDVLEYPWISLVLAGNQKALNRRGTIDIGTIQKYTHMHKVKKAALTVIATQLTDDKIDQLRDVFMTMDDNADGTLSLREVRAGICKACDLDKIPPDIDKMITQMDCDGSGAIDYTEFLAATLDKKMYHQKDVVWRAFKRFDLDGSGKIDRSELSKILKDEEVQDAMDIEPDAATEVDRLFDTIDTDGDGTIDFNEFFEMLQKETDPASPRSRHSQSSFAPNGARSSRTT